MFGRGVRATGSLGKLCIRRPQVGACGDGLNETSSAHARLTRDCEVSLEFRKSMLLLMSSMSRRGFGKAKLQYL